MSKKIKISELPEFDVTEILDTDEDVAAYLTVVLEENDPAALGQALQTVSRARGMTEMAKATGLSRESLYKSLRPNSHPRFETVMKVCQALGVKLVAQAA